MPPRTRAAQSTAHTNPKTPPLTLCHASTQLRACARARAHTHTTQSHSHTRLHALCRCLSTHPKSRPDIGEVVTVLTGLLSVIEGGAPSQPSAANVTDLEISQGGPEPSGPAAVLVHTSASEASSTAAPALAGHAQGVGSALIAVAAGTGAGGGVGGGAGPGDSSASRSPSKQTIEHCESLGWGSQDVVGAAMLTSQESR